LGFGSSFEIFTLAHISSRLGHQPTNTENLNRR
jgi:hypothetical protein